MAHIVKGAAHCAKPGCDRSWARDPVLEVACPDCRAPIGARCRRPSGHAGPLIDLHASRDILADRDGHYGRCPFGICGMDPMPTQASPPAVRLTVKESSHE